MPPTSWTSPTFGPDVAGCADVDAVAVAPPPPFPRRTSQPPTASTRTRTSPAAIHSTVRRPPLSSPSPSALGAPGADWSVQYEKRCGAGPGAGAGAGAGAAGVTGKTDVRGGTTVPTAGS